MDKNKETTEDLLNRGIERIVGLSELKKALNSGRKLKVKLGIDPTGPRIHIGRAFQFWKLKQFQDLGHQVILIIGDFTAQVGDASDKAEARKLMAESEIAVNVREYKKQVGMILDLKKTKIVYNSKNAPEVSASTNSGPGITLVSGCPALPISAIIANSSAGTVKTIFPIVSTLGIDVTG